jgi:hypothetical protein
MSTLLIVFIILVWLVSAVYVMLYHNKRWTLGLDVIIGAIILGPILALLIGDNEERIIKQKHKKEKESNERHRKWFQTFGLINGERTSNIGQRIPPHVYSNRTIPPPPPISRVEPPNRRFNNKDFKFFQK